MITKIELEEVLDDYINFLDRETNLTDMQIEKMKDNAKEYVEGHLENLPSSQPIIESPSINTFSHNKKSYVMITEYKGVCVRLQRQYGNNSRSLKSWQNVKGQPLDTCKKYLDSL